MNNKHHELEILKVMFAENRVQQQRMDEKCKFENSNLKKLIFSFSDETNGTIFRTSNEYCNAIDKTTFLELWNFQTPSNISTNMYLEEDVKIKLTKLTQLAKEVVVNDINYTQYIKDLTTKQREYQQSVITMRIKMCRTMNRKQMFLFQTGGRYSYNFYSIDNRKIDPQSFRLNKSPPVTRYALHIYDKTYVTDMWEFFYTQNMFPACMLYAFVPDQMQLSIMNKERSTATLKRPLTFKNSEKAHFYGKFLTSQYHVTAPMSSSWFEFIYDNMVEEKSSLEPKEPSPTSTVVKENEFPSETKLKEFGDLIQVSQYLVNKIKTLLRNTLDRKLYHQRWTEWYLNLLWFISKTLDYIRDNYEEKAVENICEKIQNYIMDTHKVNKVEMNSFISSLWVQNLNISNRNKEIINHLFIKR